MTERRLLLVRHGVTDWNREGRFQGHRDPPLSEDGLIEAQLVADRMATDPTLRVERILTSSLARASQTAEAIAASLGLRVEPDARLIEIGQGEWEGRTHDDLARTDAQRYAAWRTAPSIRQPPGGEPIEVAADRVSAVLGEVLAGDGTWPVCIVSHGGTIRLLARELLEAVPTASWALDVDNASLGICSARTDGWRLERWNDVRHLLGRTPTHIDEDEGRPLAL